jgi:hypothetical protein
LCEDVLADAIDACGLVDVRREVNFQRTIWASYGMGLRLRMRKRKLQYGGQELELPESDVMAFSFSPHELSLDPDNTNRDLLRHEYIIFTSVWSARKMREWLDLRLEEDQLKSVGELAPFYLSVNQLTDNQLYAQYKTNSRTKGALVHQVHVKGENGLFDTMYICVEAGSEEPRCLNFDEPETPFGGSGLPLALYHAHRRTDGPYGLSDVAMLKDDQDRLNLAETVKFRHLLNSGGFKMLVDRSTLGREGSEDSFRSQMTNSVGGPLFWTSGPRDRPGTKPELLQFPQPPPMLQTLADQYEMSMREQVHRSEGNFGATKSHVPNASFQSAIEQADQVPGTRMVEDLETDVRILEALLGTVMKQVKQMSPCTLGRLRAKRFAPDDLAMLYQMDPVHLECRVRVREGSVRYRSANAKREDLTTALVQKAILPEEFRIAAARDLDMPVMEDDRFFERKCAKIAQMVLRGMHFEPLPLGKYTPWLLAALRRALLDDAAHHNPEIQQNIAMAIQAQEMMMAQEMGVLQGADPNMQGGGVETEHPMDKVLMSLGGGGAPQAA